MQAKRHTPETEEYEAVRRSLAGPGIFRAEKEDYENTSIRGNLTGQLH